MLQYMQLILQKTIVKGNWLESLWFMLHLFGIPHNYIIYFTWHLKEKMFALEKALKINLYFILNYATMISKA